MHKYPCGDYAELKDDPNHEGALEELDYWANVRYNIAVREVAKSKK